MSGSSQDASTEEDNADSHSNVIPWTISNKYYTADVQFRILDPTSASAIEEALKNGEEPAVVVLTRSQEVILGFHSPSRCTGRSLADETLLIVPSASAQDLTRESGCENT